MEFIGKTQSYFYVFGQTPVFFEETSWGGISPTVPNENAKELTKPSLTFLRLIQTYESDTKKIRSRYGKELGSLENIDFSNLGLTQLPPHILLECRNARRLDISGNDIHFLPVQLQELRLVSLNISGNTKLQPNIPEWLGRMPGLTLVANEIDLGFVPTGFTHDQIESKDLPLEGQHDFGQTQAPITNGVFH